MLIVRGLIPWFCRWINVIVKVDCVISGKERRDVYLRRTDSCVSGKSWV